MFQEEKLLSPDEVMQRINYAYQNKSPLSIVRLGDGEALTLSQELILSCKEIKKREWLPYAGLIVPDLESRDQLAKSIKKADIVGVAMNSLPDFTPLLIKSFSAHNIDTHSLALTNACINYFLLENDRLKRFLVAHRKPKVLLIGNRASQLLPFLTREGVKVVGLLKMVRGLKDWPRVVKLTTLYKYDIALVSAGIPAVIISEKISKESKTIALDFGHAADVIIRRKYF